jgi:4-hydroxythreonine-4-phosphate dehydrogenase
LSIRIAISMGDPSGIGAEVTARALAKLRGAVTPYVYGDAGAFGPWAKRVRLALPEVDLGDALPAGGALVRVTRLPKTAMAPGRPARAGGPAQLAYLEAAYAAVAAGDADALCTAPVSKAQVQRADRRFVGHTEWLEAKSGAARSVMMLAGPKLRVALVTNHLQLSKVPRAVTASGILGTITVTHAALAGDFGIAAPRIAVCAMNPHASDEGAFGDEERRVVGPALGRARRLGMRATGPYPADSVFFRAAAGEFDAVIALYHDQGLIPVKLLDAIAGEPAVNVTLGLPIVRTSPDHGVAYDLAGKARASDRSMLAAVRLAAQLAIRRRRARAEAETRVRPSTTRSALRSGRTDTSAVRPERRPARSAN